MSLFGRASEKISDFQTEYGVLKRVCTARAEQKQGYSEWHGELRAEDLELHLNLEGRPGKPPGLEQVSLLGDIIRRVQELDDSVCAYWRENRDADMPESPEILSINLLHEGWFTLSYCFAGDDYWGCDFYFDEQTWSVLEHSAYD